MKLKLDKSEGKVIIKIVEETKELNFDYVLLTKAIINNEDITYEVTDNVDVEQSTHIKNVINHLRKIVDNPNMEVDYASFKLEKDGVVVNNETPEED